VAFIDENWCIGCTLCIDVCPTDAIIGSNKLMHTVIEPHCTGCELCLPVCPVDCIELETVTADRTGWAAWSQTEADHALKRYTIRSDRGNKNAVYKQVTPSKTPIHDIDSDKSAVIAAAMAKARAKRN
jgi:Na+-translocating ferredoxin:NAD+ oxidoreductase subunit B